jgi:hypothetical protein
MEWADIKPLFYGNIMSCTPNQLMQFIEVVGPANFTPVPLNEGQKFIRFEMNTTTTKLYQNMFSGAAGWQYLTFELKRKTHDSVVAQIQAVCTPEYLANHAHGLLKLNERWTKIDNGFVKQHEWGSFWYIFPTAGYGEDDHEHPHIFTELEPPVAGDQKVRIYKNAVLYGGTSYPCTRVARDKYGPPGKLRFTVGNEGCVREVVLPTGWTVPIAAKFITELSNALTLKRRVADDEDHFVEQYARLKKRVVEFETIYPEAVRDYNTLVQM